MNPAPNRLSAPVRLALAWAGLILIGAVVLRLPASARGAPLNGLDALFTSTSAVCVTGLTTITIGERLSGFGQTVVLILIQLGGLGISAVSTLLLLGVRRTTLSQQFEVQRSLAAVRVKPLRLLWWVVFLTLAAEGVGAMVLARRIGGNDGWWQGLFHSVSAFCNAGFSLYPESLTGFRSDALVTGTVAGLIMLGGLGFVVLRQLCLYPVSLVRGGRRRPLFLHTRVVVVGSITLWLLGAAMFLLFEWHTSLAPLTGPARVLAAGFQSVTTRTAGFNTIDFSAMREATLFVTMFLMFIGGAPGSCAGGVKITTALVVLATVRAHYRGAKTVTVLKRTIPPDIVQRAFQLVTLSVLFLAVIIMGMLITEEHLPTPAPPIDHFTSLAFEAVSAFGTVGLSTGVTPTLSASGKLLIVVTMFVGRLGPLMVAVAVLRPRARARFEYPEEELAIG